MHRLAKKHWGKLASYKGRILLCICIFCPVNLAATAFPCCCKAVYDSVSDSVSGLNSFVLQQVQSLFIQLKFPRMLFYNLFTWYPFGLIFFSQNSDSFCQFETKLPQRFRKWQNTRISSERYYRPLWPQTQPKLGPFAGCILREMSLSMFSILVPNVGANSILVPSTTQNLNPVLEPCSGTQSIVLVKLSTGIIGTCEPEQCTPISLIPGSIPHASSTSSPRGGISTRELQPRLLERLSFNFYAATYTIRYNSVKEVHTKPAAQWK